LANGHARARGGRNATAAYAAGAGANDVEIVIVSHEFPVLSAPASTIAGAGGIAKRRQDPEMPGEMPPNYLFCAGDNPPAGAVTNHRSRPLPLGRQTESRSSHLCIRQFWAWPWYRPWRWVRASRWRVRAARIWAAMAIAASRASTPTRTAPSARRNSRSAG